MKKQFTYMITASALLSLSAFADEATTNEVSEIEALTQRLEKLEASQEKSSWSEKIKFKGDLRYRYEYVEKDGSTHKNRQRIRARLGAYADVNDWTKAGLRIRTGQEANSGNQTIGDNWDGKGIFLDLAYMSLAPSKGDYGSLTLGKMKYPWETTTDLIWDGDVNPEGAAYNYELDIDEVAIFAHAGGFKINDTSRTGDVNMFSAQIGATIPIGEELEAIAGGSIFKFEDHANNFDRLVGEGFASVTLPANLSLYGNVVGSDADDDNMGGCLGAKASIDKFSASLDYRRLEANAAIDAFADSDIAGGGTDVQGARLKTKYKLAKNLSLGATFIAGEIISSKTEVNTLQLDAIVKF